MSERPSWIGRWALALVVLGVGVLVSLRPDDAPDTAGVGADPGVESLGPVDGSIVDATRDPAPSEGDSLAPTPLESRDPAGPIASTPVEVAASAVPELLVRVRAQPGGQALEGAEVQWSADLGDAALARESGSTDAAGVLRRPLAFVSELTRTAQAALRIEVQAFAPGFGPARILGTLGSLESGVLELVLELSPGPSLSGQVLDSSGRALPCFIQLHTEPGSTSAAGLGVRILRTDDQGQYRLALDGARALELRARHPQLGAATLDLSQRELEGDVRLPDLVLQLGRVIEGVARCADGNPIPHLTVEALRVGGGALVPRAVSDHEGRFRLFGLEAGTFRLWLRGVGAQDGPLAEVPAGTLDALLEVERELLWVELSDAEGRALGGQELQCVSLARDAAGQPDMLTSRSLETREDGCALFAPSTRRVVLRTEVGDLALVEETLDLFPGCLQRHAFRVPEPQPPGFLALDVRGPGGEPLSHFEAEVISSASREELDSFDATDLAATGGLRPLPPGEYRLRLDAGGWSGADYSLAQRDPTPFVIRSGETSRVMREVIEGGRLRLRVSAASGPAPPAGLRVGTRVSSAKGKSRELFFGHEGEDGTAYASWLFLDQEAVSADLLTPGTHELILNAQGFPPLTVSVLVLAGETVPVRAVLQAE